jgi:DNA-binding CsgD family transcriptional regulator
MTTQYVGRGASPAFVGRQRELAELDSLLDDAIGGHGAVAMLVGQPGVGKTRTVLEFADRAARRGTPVLFGLCHEEPGMPPYWPWRQVVRGLIASHGQAVLAERCGDALGEVALVVPEISDGPLPGEQGLADPDLGSRFRVFDAISRLVAGIAAEQPIVIVIENLHLADAPSLSLLEFIVPALHSTPILIVGTYRDVELSRGHPMSCALGRLVGQPDFHRMHLQGFELLETEALMADLTGGLAKGEIVPAIHRQTEGNPLFVIQVVRYLLDAGFLAARQQKAGLPASVRVPEGVRDAVGQRLNRLSDRCNALLKIASVLGRHFEMDELIALSDEFGDEDRYAFLEEALEACIVEEVAGSCSRLQFTHALIRETLYDEIPATRRIQLHALAAEVIERLRKDTTDSVLSRLAHHYFEGQLVTGPDKVIEYASRAASRATRILAYEDAARCWSLAIDCADLGGRKRERETCEMRMQLGIAQRKAGDVKSAVQTFAMVARIADELGDVDLYAEAALEAESARWRPGLPGDLTIDLLENAIDRLPTRDSELRCKLVGSLARALSYSDRGDRAASLAHESVEIARRLDTPNVLCTTLDHAVVALRRQPDRAATRLGYCREQLTIAEALGSTELAAAAHSTLRSELLETAELTAFEQSFESFQALTRKLRQPHYEYQLAFVNVMRALLVGDFERVPALSEHALYVGSRLQGSDADGVYAVQMFTLHRERGTLGQFAPFIQSLLGDGPEAGVWSPGLALLYAEIGELAQARSLLESLATNDFGAINSDELWLTSMMFLAEVCVAVDARAYAEAIYELLLPHRGKAVVFGPGIVCYGPVDRPLGLLAVVSREWRDADRHFSVAAEVAGKLASGPAIARVECDHAWALQRRGARSANLEARALIESVLALAGKFGMAGVARKAEMIERALRADGVHAGPDDLTPREIDVLRLIADGRSNKQVADALNISMATVATHVRNILSKTGTENRTAAAACAREQKLFA